MTQQHLIIGAGPAGLAAARTIREVQADAGITLVGSENPYARMVLPYLMEGRIEETQVYSADDAYLEGLGVEARFGSGVTGIDPTAGSVSLEDGDTLAYDSLLIATGSRSARPDIPGIDQEGVIGLWNLSDAQRFLTGPHRDVAIIGAGFIAFTILDAVIHRADRVHLVEIEEQILPRMLDEASASLLSSQLEEAGLELHTGTSVESIEANGERRTLRLANGSSIEADLVIVATGILPNLEFTRSADIATDTGILVDGHMATNVPNIFAAGDVAEGPMLHSDTRWVHAIQPTAIDHGRVAGANMAGEPVLYAGSLLMNVLAAQGLEAASFGLWDADDLETTRVQSTTGRVYRKYVWQEDRLVGGIMLGSTQALSGQNDVGMLKGLIQTGVALGPWKDFLCENPLDLRRAFVASGAARQLASSSMLAGRVAKGGGFRPGGGEGRQRSPHHASLVTGAP